MAHKFIFHKVIYTSKFKLFDLLVLQKIANYLQESNGTYFVGNKIEWFNMILFFDDLVKEMISLRFGSR